MNFLVSQQLLHGLEPRVALCIPALGELRLRSSLMSELSKHINIIYTSIYSIAESRRRQ